MPAFYRRPQGTVRRVISPGDAGVTLPFYVRFNGLKLGSEIEASAIITQSSIMMEELYHASNAVGGDSYIYALGDKHDNLQVSGVAFSASCEPGSADNGLQHILDLYRDNRLSRRSSPLLVAFSRAVYRCYLVSGQMGMTDAERQIGQWTLVLKGVRRI